MSASMTLTITEDDAPDGCVEVSFKVDGFDIEDARVNGDLPPAVLLGARLMQVVEQELPSSGGRPVPPPTGHLPTRPRRR
jgi:hypothetical protein